jgi:hypothetical protein
MSKPPPDCLTDQHLILFGKIVQWFAGHEMLMQDIMATVSGADVTSIKILTAGLGFSQKHTALFDLLRHRAVPIDRQDEVRKFLVPLQNYTQLRNDIVHSLWTEALPQNAIWPVWLTAGPLNAVKPAHDPGGASKTFVEGEEDRASYTLEDLREIATTLAHNHAAFCAYATETNLMPANEPQLKQ